MLSPFTGKEMKLTYEKRMWKFHGEEYEYMHASWLCTDTGERFTTDETDDAGYVQVTNKYRARYGIPYTDEIIALRKRYALSAAKMSLILGFGVNQWRSYEGGEVPSVSNGRMIRSIMNPSVFLEVVNSAKHVLGEAEFQKLSFRIKDLMDRCDTDDSVYDAERIFICERGEENGFGECSVDKVKNVILAVLEYSGEVFCTKMNKLLFYIDFLSYRSLGRSVTGLSYRALPYGPVPERWDRIYSCFDEIVLEPRIAGEKEGLVIVPTIKRDDSILTAEELRVIECVCQRFKDVSSADISRISHEEDAWKDFQSGHRRISYEYAFGLKAL